MKKWLMLLVTVGAFSAFFAVIVTLGEKEPSWLTFQWAFPETAGMFLAAAVLFGLLYVTLNLFTPKEK